MKTILSPESSGAASPNAFRVRTFLNPRAQRGGRSNLFPDTAFFFIQDWCLLRMFQQRFHLRYLRFLRPDDLSAQVLDLRVGEL